MTPPARRLRSLALFVPLLSACGGGGGGAASGGSGPPPTIDADLTVVSVTFSPLSVDAGQTILVEDVVANSGSATAPAFRVGVYLSDDPLIASGDLLLGFRTVPALPGGAQDAGGGELTIPLGTTAGTWYVGAIADDQDDVGEPDEQNNATVAVDPLEVSAPLLPDLVPTVVVFTPAVVDAGDPIQVDDVVENQGEAGSGPFQVGLYLSSDSIITSADTLLGVRQVSDLAPGNANQGSGSVTVPASTPAGLYYVGTLADDTDQVVEQSEGNNAAVAGTFLEVTTPPLPDLVPTHVTFNPVAIDAGDPILVSEGVLNQGVASAPSFQVGVYLSVDSIIDEGDVLLGFRTVAELNEGDESAVVDWSLEVPADTPAGTYWVGVRADDSELVPESSEANNTLVALASLSVEVPPLPNLRPVSLEFSPKVINVDDGDLLHLEEVVENASAWDAGTFRVGVYLSPNSVLTTSDLLIASRVVTTLGAGGSTGSVQDVTLPGGISDGSYFVGVIADDLDEQGETSEGDNVLVAAGPLDVVSSPNPQPDLVMDDCTYSGNKKAPGSTFQVVTRVTNEGDLSAAPFHVGVYLSVDAEIGPDDVLLGERFLPGGLSSGFTNVSSEPVTIPSDQPEGTYFVGAFADNQFVIAESEEDDNDFTSPGTLVIEIPPPPAPELYVLSSSHDGGVHSPGDTVTLDDTLRNKGQVDAGSFRVGYYLSSDSTIEVTDVLLDNRVLASLAVGAEDAASTALVLPAGTPAGDYWLGIVVDDQFAVTENDEDDNFVTVLPMITVQ